VKLSTHGHKAAKNNIWSQASSHIEVWECLLSFGTESIVFPVVIQKYKY